MVRFTFESQNLLVLLLENRKVYDAPLTRKRRNILLISQSSPPVADRRDDPYGSIGHYPELHMDIHELEHHEIDSEHEGHFGSCGFGGGYGWCPGDIGKLQMSMF